MIVVTLIPLLLLAFPAGDPTPAGSYDELKRDGLALVRSLDFAMAEATLKAALAKAPKAADERAKVSLLLARAQNGLGRPSDALGTLAGVARTAIPEDLRSLFVFEKARAMALAKDKGAADALKAFLRDHARSRVANQARLLLAGALLEAKDLASAAQAAQAVLDSRPNKAERAEATLMLAYASDEPRRSELQRRIFVEMPDTRAAMNKAQTEADLSKEELARRASEFFDAMDYEEAQRIREAMWAGGDRSPALAYKLAMSHLVYVRDDPSKAIGLLEIAEKGGAVGKAEATFQRARAWAKLEDYDRAGQEYRKYLDLGGGEKRVDALYYLGWLPYDHGDYAKALPHIDRFLKEVRSHDLRSYMIWAKGWSLYKLKRYRDALKVFNEMIPLGNCLVAGKAMYWGGMAHRALGDKDQARAWMRRAVKGYPLTYYAVLAAKRLHEWEGAPLPGWMTGPAVGLPDPRPYWPFDKVGKRNAAVLRRVRDLAEVGEIERARALYRPIAAEVEKAIKELPDRARFLLTVYDAIEDYHELYQRAGDDFKGKLGTIPTKESALYWMVGYPRAHRSFATVLARRFNMPEHWVYSIMRQESRYSPGAVSHTAALGLMQMIPKTAKVISKGLGVPFDVESFFAPGRNMLFCNYYLGALLKDFKGQLVFASAAYNAGAPSIKKFLARHKGLPFDEMVEHISYNEARNYCRKVAEHHIRYAYLHVPQKERLAVYKAIFPDKVDYDVGGEVDY